MSQPPRTAQTPASRRRPWWRRDGRGRALLRLLRRLAPFVTGVVVVVLAVAGLMWRPSTVSSAHRADYVVVAGAAGLRWDDVNPVDTPTLWKLASTDAIGALSVRSAHSPTCPSDGWLTLGAGNYARVTTETVQSTCPDNAPSVGQPDSLTGTVAGQDSLVERNRALQYRAEPGALADAVRCTVGIGPNAALAAARPYGRVDRYEPAMPPNLSKVLSSCTLSIVDLGTVSGTTPAARKAQARAVDRQLATVMAHRPANSLLLVAGLSDTDRTSRLHVAIADGPGYTGGWLSSASTGRQGYLQLVDLAPTALAALGRPVPTKLFAGAQAQRVGARPANPGAAIDRLSDADDEAAVQHRVAGGFFTILTVGEILLLGVAIPLLRRARRSAEPLGAAPVPPRIVRYVEAMLIAAALTIVVALLTGLLPWWRAQLPGPLFAVIGGLIAVIIVIVVLWEPWRQIARIPRRPSSGGVLGPLTAVSAIVVAVLGIDVLTGSRLQLNGVAGYSAAEGTRYAGIGAIGLGAFVFSILVLGACLAQFVGDRRWRPFVVGAVGAVGVIIVGSPQLGSDPGGALALTAGACVAAAVSRGGWLTFTRLGWATLTGLAVLIGFAFIDLHQSVVDRGPVGRFLTDLHDGTAGRALHQTAVADLVATVTNPLSLLIPVAVVYTLVVLLRPWGGMMRLFGLYPAVRGALIGTMIAATVAGLADGVGLTTVGAALAVGLPMVALAALRVLDHADDRTRVRSVPVLTGSESADRLVGGASADALVGDEPADTPAGDDCADAASEPARTPAEPAEATGKPESTVLRQRSDVT